MKTLDHLYKPLTAYPFMRREHYQEFLPAEHLRPYIACFWCSVSGLDVNSPDHLVVPDTCMDIIFTVTQEATARSSFIMLNDAPFQSDSITAADRKVLFGIRFYFWTAHMFLHDSLKGSANAVAPTDQFFDCWDLKLREQLHLEQPVSAWITAAESLITLSLPGIHANHQLLNATHKMLATKGRTPIRELAAYAAVSPRQLERLFQEHIGMPPKQISSLVRYQNVWRDYISGQERDVHTLALKYGYTDQAHLLHQFKRYHGCTLSQANRIASADR